MKTYISKLHYKKDLNGTDKIVLFVLKIVSIPYFIGSSIKNYLYKKNLLKSYDTGCRIISVGNLTTGGTGKTPITAEIAKYLAKNGEKVCIVSRGYKGKLNNKTPNLISDGETIFYDANMAGDEPYWLSVNCKGVAVVTCSDRKKGIEFYKQKTGCKTFILDDGFQHRKAKRNLNLLVIDGEKKFGNEMILPAGPLREPLTEIYRADKIIIVNKKTHNRGLRGYKRVLERALNMPVFLCDMKLGHPYNIHNDEPFNYERVLAFCAIGQPEQFFNLLTANVAGQEIFEDHHDYSEEDIEYLIKKANEHGATALITTEKDAVKIKNLKNAKKIKIYAAKLVPDIKIEEILA